MSGDAIEMVGVVVDENRGGIFAVDCQAGALKRRVLARLAGRLFTNRIRVLPGDTVTVEVSPYDLSRGRIVFRGERRRVNAEASR